MVFVFPLAFVVCLPLRLWPACYIRYILLAAVLILGCMLILLWFTLFDCFSCVVGLLYLCDCL